MTRQVVLDTETTGLDPRQGHRLIEIGCVEIVNRRLTSNTFHEYLNPERDIDEGAVAVHGIEREHLEDKPRFEEVAERLLDFVRGAEVLIHNAEFDCGFLDNELALAGKSFGCLTDHCMVTDTLALARSLHPGQRNTLDALCVRYEIDNSRRVLHGALLDAQILADVYLAMTGGQGDLTLEADDDMLPDASAPRLRPDGAQIVVVPSDAEFAAHRAFLEFIASEADAGLVWEETDSPAAAAAGES